MPDFKVPICIVTAIKAEAAPFVNHYKLVKQAKHPLLQQYGEPPLRVVVTGIGQKACFDAVIAASQTADSNEVFINIGIAGTAGLAVGSLVWPAECARQSINSGPPKKAQGGLVMHSVDTPCEAYEDGVIFDMEARGFYMALATNAPLQRAFCAKVISDNERHSLHTLERAHVSDLVRKQLPAFELFFSSL